MAIRERIIPNAGLGFDEHPKKRRRPDTGRRNYKRLPERLQSTILNQAWPEFWPKFLHGTEIWRMLTMNENGYRGHQDVNIDSAVYSTADSQTEVRESLRELKQKGIHINVFSALLTRRAYEYGGQNSDDKTAILSYLSEVMRIASDEVWMISAGYQNMLRRNNTPRSKLAPSLL